MPRNRRDPFEPGLDLEERRSRIPGYRIKLQRTHSGQTWDEELTATGLRSFDEISGNVELFAIVGRPEKDFDPYRESGQFRAINTSEILKRSEAVKRERTTRTPRAKSENSFVVHAETILRAKGKPMHVKDITAAALAAGLTTSGKTPAATMGARLGGAPDHFEKLGKGMFDLKS
jgi:hypothetical protein